MCGCRNLLLKKKCYEDMDLCVCVLVSVNKEVLDCVVLIIFLNCSSKGRYRPEEMIVHFLLRHSRGKAKPIMRLHAAQHFQLS